MFIFDAGDGAHPSYFSYRPRFDRVNGGLLLLLLTKILDTLRCIGFNNLTLRMGTEPVLTVEAIFRCSEEIWKNTIVLNGFVSCGFRTSEFYGLKKYFLQVIKQF